MSGQAGGFALPSRDTLFRIAATLALSTAGGGLFALIGLPAAWISGGMLFVAASSLAGFHTEIPSGLRNVIFLVLGVISGTGVTPATLNEVSSWPVSFFALAITVVLVTVGSYLLLVRMFRWDRHSALFAALPGALSFVLAAAEMTSADLRRVAIAQSLRLIILLEALPLAAFLAGVHPSAGGARGAAPVDWGELFLLFATGAVCGFLLYKLRIPGGQMLGGLLAAAALCVSGVVETAIPAFILIPSLVGIGAIAGCRLRPEDRPLLPKILTAAGAAFAIAVVISAIGAAITSMILDISLLQTFMAFAPGALEALTILAFTMNVDPAYVAAHHVVRFAALALAVPLLARWLMRQEAHAAPDPEEPWERGRSERAKKE
ncbi:membrane AbrB-like protein [Rhodopseudomonas julia]|uniref:Membrane AbrB-like protein n=1 Tax=Rhodopseudomonas julia TaxID=200617 RepID=A0ABU0C811_9BRAD|nr:AbrB family transcriptional regulator [Rhodopseudomonas julia]MDQ0325192.1 membrane AbrB-like protein [Rhodopseudomonas julia]